MSVSVSETYDFELHDQLCPWPSFGYKFCRCSEYEARIMEHAYRLGNKTAIQ